MKGRREAGKEVGGKDLPSKPPEHLGPHASRVWRETVQVLVSAGRPLKEVHREVLDGLCEASADVITAGEILANEGCVMEGGREGFKRHPASSIRAQALTIKRAYLAELGMTPTSSGRLSTPPKKTTSNKFADL